MVKKDWNAYRDYTPEKVMEIFTPFLIQNAQINIIYIIYI